MVKRWVQVSAPPLAANLEAIHFLSRALVFLRCKINITLLLSVRICATSGHLRSKCQDGKGSDTPTVSSTPVREMGAGLGGPSGHHANVCPALERMDWARPLGVMEPKPLPMSAGNGLVPAFLPHSSLDREPGRKTVVNYSPSQRSEGTFSHHQGCQKNLRICLALVEVLRLELD